MIAGAVARRVPRVRKSGDAWVALAPVVADEPGAELASGSWREAMDAALAFTTAYADVLVVQPPWGSFCVVSRSGTIVSSWRTPVMAERAAIGWARQRCDRS